MIIYNDFIGFWRKIKFTTIIAFLVYKNYTKDDFCLNLAFKKLGV